MAKGKRNDNFLTRAAARSPLAVVLIVAGIVLSVFLSARFVLGGAYSSKHSYPQFVFEQKEVKAKASKTVVTDVPADRPLFDGEVYRTSLRVQEALDLQIGSVLYLSAQDDGGGPVSPEEFVARLPETRELLLAGMRDRGLLPPGVTVAEDFKLSSDASYLVVRYRREPLDFEVVSLPRVAGTGPALLVRLVDGGEGGVARYYESMRLQDINVPEPFSPTSKVLESGWTLQEIRGQMVSREDVSRARAQLLEAGVIQKNR